MADHLLVTDYRVCTGCRTCEMVCSLWHEGECNPEKSRINIVQHDSQGLDIPIVCQQCRNPVCRTVCPTKAISREAATGAMRVDEQKCNGCEACAFACYFGAIKIRYAGKRTAVLMCDLCGGDPQCVKYCDTHALAFAPADRDTLERKGRSMRDTLFQLGRLSTNTSESRLLNKITEIRDRASLSVKGG